MSAGKKQNVLWAGRLAEKPSARAFEFESSIKIDKRLVFDDIAGSLAHVKMLGVRGIIPKDSAELILETLAAIENDIKSGSLALDEEDEDIHSFIENVLTGRIGDAGRMVHAGRSRNDQVAADFRLYLKREIPLLCAGIKEAALAVLDQAALNTETIMPGYTHLQRAQTVTLGHHLCAWAASMLRDKGRFEDALCRLDECPLGGGALAGSSLPLDREAVRLELGFSRCSANSMDAVASRDFAVELAAAAAIAQAGLSRFCEDIVLWASEEFKFIELDEAWSTGSSIMPQKKNPDFAELVRGKSARTAGNLVTLLTLLKGLPYAYNKDLQEDKEALFDSLDTLKNSLEVFCGMIKSAKWNKEKMSAACAGGFLEATDAAEYLVCKGLPFRKAHEVAALVVRDSIEAGAHGIGELSLERLKSRSELFEEDIYGRLSPLECVKRRDLPGGPAPARVIEQISFLRNSFH